MTMTMADQTVYTVAPPHNREAEEGVLGSVLINPEIFHECRIHIASRDEFYIDRHKMIWDAYERMFANKIPVDLVTLTDELDNLGTLHEVGGPAYLTSMTNQVASSLNAPAYAQIVHDHYTRRKIINAANDITSVAYDEQVPMSEVSAKSTHSLSQAVASAANAHSHHINDSLKRVDAKIEERGRIGFEPGIPTGLIDLDRILGGGAQNSDLLLISGRPGDGKSAALFQFMRNAAWYKLNQKVYKNRVALFSMEMPEEQIVLRLLTQISGIDYQMLRSGKIQDADIPRYIHALEGLSCLDITIDDTPGVSPAYIRSRCEILNAERKLDAVFIDSLNLMRSGLNFKRSDQEVDYNATQLKNIAREFDIPVWCAHQMNRGKEQRGINSRPILADLREGGEQPADAVIFIYHEHDKDDPKRITGSELIVAKQRNGPADYVCVVFLGAQTKFESAFRVRSE